MNTARFCEQCGSVLEPGDKFCMSCGHPVEVVPQPSPVASSAIPPADAAPAPAPQAQAPVPQFQAPVYQAVQPVSASIPARTTPSLNPVMIVIALVVLAGLGGGAWWFMRGKPQSPPVTNKPAATTSATNPNQPTVTTPVAAQPGEDFVGRWYPDGEIGETDGEFLVIKRQGTMLIGTGKDPSSGRFEFAAKGGAKLTGVLKQEGSSIPATFELLSDKKKMVITVAPPQSEYQTAVFWRDTGAPPDTGTPPTTGGASETDVPGIEKITSYTEDQARSLVAMQPDVAKYVKQLASKKQKVHIDVAPEDEQTYSVHVYEVVDDGDGMAHTATFGWYKVDRKTGKVSPGM